MKKHGDAYLELDSTMRPALSCSSNHLFKVSSSLIVMAYALVLSSPGACSAKLISWSYSLFCGIASNSFLLNRCVNGHIYFGKSSSPVLSGSLSSVGSSVWIDVCQLLNIVVCLTR